MRDLVKVTGMVLKAAPVGDFDKRLVLLTRERGKITAFARGARKPGSSVMAACRPFSFGIFSMYEGRDAYTMTGAEIQNYFEELSKDVEGACYGSYFLELADYYARENVDETDMLKLLYQSLRALLKPALNRSLVLSVFELKVMVINGEYTEHPEGKACDSANYTWEFVITSPLENLYTFTVTEPVLLEFKSCVERNKKRFIDRSFHSLDILKALS